ncbi:MAG TPA: extracellular solute-binding protein [Herbaspirillum sp.]|jgi:iron(III) transport system substrate-binding protein
MIDIGGRGIRYLKLVGGFVAAALLSGPAMSAPPAAGAPGPNDAMYMYRGADRDQKLVEQAKKEGTLTLYTSLATNESMPLTTAFEKKYGIKVVLWRTTSDKVVQRAVSEGQAGRHVADVMETNGPEVEMMARERLLSEFYSPYLADFSPSAMGPNRLWVSDRLNFFVVVFNTNKFKRSDMPATYEGFLDPKWKGQLSIESTDVEWMATVIKKMGNDKGMKFFQSLADMHPEMRMGHVLLAQMVATGDAPVALTVYNANAESLKMRGAPVDWFPVQPVVGRPQGIGVAKQAPHPHAALLFADFVLSPEGQKMFADMGRVPASPKVKTPLNNFPYVMTEAATVLDESAKWEKLWNQLFFTK